MTPTFLRNAGPLKFPEFLTQAGLHSKTFPLAWGETGQVRSVCRESREREPVFHTDAGVSSDLRRR
jgi:hypothetical protein